MNIEINSLLAPVSTNYPAGNELDYDHEFISLVTEMQGKPEQQYGDTLIQAVAPDWTRVSREAQLLLGKSKDFRLAVMITRALTNTQGVPGALIGIKLLLAMVEQYWESGFPALEFEGEADPLPRSNALAEMTSGNGLVKDLRERMIHSRKLGVISLGSLERIQQSRDALDDVPLTRENINDFLQDELADGNPDISALPELLQHTDDLSSRIRLLMGAEFAPDFTMLCSFLSCLVRTGQAGVDAQQLMPLTAQPVGQAAACDNGTGHPEQMGRESAVAMLDAVCAYLEQSDPANPAPLLIRRARKMIGQDFVSILKEIAPDGLHQVEMITGISARE